MNGSPRELWDRIVKQIRAGDPAGQSALYEAFAPGLRLFLGHHIQRPEEVEDRLHDAFVKAVVAIRGGQLREPERLAGFLRTIAWRQITAFIDQAVEQRSLIEDLSGALRISSPGPSPEQLAIDRQWTEQAIEILQSFPALDREILVRFYWEEQSAGQICRELNLTPTQFRLRKTRAKGRFVREASREFSRVQMRKRTPVRH